MTAESGRDEVEQHWERYGLAEAIRTALDASGLDRTAMTIDDLAPLDQFHGGGIAFTRRLAELAGLTTGMRVLDVGGGLGGPARTLALEYGCDVTVVDLAESYVEAGRMLTSLLGLDERVTSLRGDALDLPFEDGTFDVVWTQNSGMNIAAKDRLYTGFRRLLRPGGRLAIQEPMAGPVRPPVYPLMWARDPGTDHLRPPEEMLDVIEASGFRSDTWGEVTIERPGPGAPRRMPTIQSLVMGEARVAEIIAASRRNELERRIVMVHAVFAAEPGS